MPPTISWDKIKSDDEQAIEWIERDSLDFVGYTLEMIKTALKTQKPYDHAQYVELNNEAQTGG